jgi:hypothetical protein
LVEFVGGVGERHGEFAGLGAGQFNTVGVDVDRSHVRTVAVLDADDVHADVADRQGGAVEAAGEVAGAVAG